jgi:hypothetical protein
MQGGTSLPSGGEPVGKDLLRCLKPAEWPPGVMTVERWVMPSAEREVAQVVRVGMRSGGRQRLHSGGYLISSRDGRGPTGVSRLDRGR